LPSTIEKIYKLNEIITINRSKVKGKAKGRFALGGCPQSQTYLSLNREKKK